MAKVPTPRKKRKSGYSDDDFDIINDMNKSIKKDISMNFKVVQKFKNKKQKELFDMIMSNRVVVIKGSAGTGKSYISLMASLECLKNKKDFNIEKIILTKPIIEASAGMGFLPGTVEEKIAPYMQSFRSNFNKLIGEEQAIFLLNNKILEEAPLNFIRGNTIGDTDLATDRPIGYFAILDEAQNATMKDVKLFISRLGEGSKMIIMGDDDQTDLKLNRNEKTGLCDAYDRFQGLEGVGFFEFTDDDIIRDKFLIDIMKRYKI